MTVQREEPGLLIACCDECGVRQELDLDADAGRADITATLAEIGWLHRASEWHRFGTGGAGGGHSEEYQRDTCPDCRDGDTKPAPVFGRARKPAARFTGDDPVDEWPRGPIWEGEGLNPLCGHRRVTGSRCPQCEAGHPMGENRSWWQR